MTETAATIVRLCTQRGLSVTTAESCTGGLVSAALTAIPGSSAMFQRGFVTYSNEAKADMLGVSPATLDAHGAVSEEVAGEMAQGALRAARADIAVSISGIAGPGGSEHKPEGRVCFGLATQAGVETLTREFGPLGRDGVRRESVVQALDLIANAIEG
ncbi:CinA family protein [Thalassorhabdomicrobium marinisediminis]|uniref:CinA family protein n=1 Tax=Thalassorhabdomicrobium marinisediminis TaxID=2170577 RepID=UPI002492E222|nr:CinA family protein [Thalassorhabdomicrobium marinisediminis]